MFTRPLILRDLDSSGGGGSAVADAPAAAGAEPAVVSGPREFSPGRAKFPSMREALEAHGNPDPNRAKPADKPVEKPASKTAEKAPEKPVEKPVEKPEDKPAEAAKPADAKPADSKTVETWKSLKQSVKTERARAETAEARVRELESNRVPDQERSTLTQRMDTLQKENEQLQNRIRFKDYESSSEFQTKYHKPYLAAVDSAMRDLKSIPVTDRATGQQRAAEQTDLFEVVNSLMANDLPGARQRAKEIFGEEDARDVLEMAKKVRDIGFSRWQALQDEEKNGATRVQQQSEQFKRQALAIQQENDILWKQANETVINNPKDPELREFLKPKVAAEGKELTPDEIKHNERLERGFKLAHETFASIDSLRRKLLSSTKEERADAAKRLAVVTARCAGFGVVRAWGQAGWARAKTAESKLSGYEQSEPSRSGRQPNGGKKSAAGGFKASLHQSLLDHSRR